MISDCIRNKKALEDNDELFAETPPDTSKWAIKVQISYKGNDGKLKYHKQDGVGENIKVIAMMEYQADLKDKKNKKKIQKRNESRVQPGHWANWLIHETRLVNQERLEEDSEEKPND